MRIRTEVPFPYQPNALPLDQTGSRALVLRLSLQHGTVGRGVLHVSRTVITARTPLK